MKCKRFSFAMLFIILLSICANAQQSDYYVVHGANEKIAHGTHYPKAVGIVGKQSPTQVLNDIASAPRCAAYFDKTSTVFEVKSGEVVTPLITINGEWMHGYVFVDWDNSKQFEVNLEGSGPYTKGEGNELMCWSLYGHNTNGDTGWNSDGTYLSSGNVLAPGSFTVPAGLETGSTYRMRYAVQWNSIDPTGSYANFISDGGSIIDVTLKITGVAEEEDPNAGYPIDDYEEPRVGTTPDAAAWNAIPAGLNASWASRDVHYSLHEVPQLTQQEEATIAAWKGERANIQAVLYSNSDQGMMSVRMTEWKRSGVATGINGGDARFVNYVITDDFDACGNHPMTYPTWLVADVIDQDKPHAVPAMETRPIWCTLEIPRNAKAGTYTTELEIVNSSNKVVKSLKLNINVNSRSLPTVAEQKFHLDLWQQPYAVSRYYGVERWSDEHLDALRPYLQALGRAGQRTVTAIMFYEPWGEQTHEPDKFDPMVQTIKKKDGTWEYDYTVFDKYVELCAEYGITKQINCFSMVPWDMSFRYYDEASSSYKFIKTNTYASDYRDLWTNFLKAFKVHLQEKGWFEKTNIAMDERAESDMLNAYNIASSLGFNMALAGNYHSSLCDKLQDMCVALGQDRSFTTAQMNDRKAKNRVTTFYTSCADKEPNIYTNSYPAEATYLPLYAAATNLDGYLHWSWINWDEHPLTDSRYRKFGSGDTYCYYPGNRSSVRFERLIEGIHQYEKVQILREEYANDVEKSKTLKGLLIRFRNSSISGEQCAQWVNDIEAFLNGDDIEIPEPEDVKTGYYHIISKATARTEHLYNNALHEGNSMRFTLQSNDLVYTNNGIWHVTVKDNNKIGVKNGDGNPMIAGSNYGSSVAGTFNELTIGETQDVGEYRYYFFTEAINCTNGGTNFKVGGADFITTWTDGGTADDNMWRFEAVDTEGLYIYNVEIEGDKNIYVTYTHDNISETAFDGGFFLSTNKITEKQLKAGIIGNILENSKITVVDGKITVSDTNAAATPEKQDLFNTSNGDGVIPPYRIPGITTTSNGRLIAVASRLVCGTDPGYGQVDIVCRTSDNNGKTWSEIKDVAVGTGKTSAEENYFDTAFGDPAIVADRISNEVIVLAVAGCTVYGNSKTTRKNPNLIALIRSKDNGETWEEPVNITEDIYSLFDDGYPMEAAFIAGGKVFQSRIIKKDKYYRIYAAMCARPNGNRVVYSDDFGATWHALGGASALPVPGGDEPKCEEMPDGRVIISSRIAGGRLYNIYTYSNTLEGEGKWSTPEMSTFAGAGHSAGNNSTNGEILIVPVVRNSDNKDMYLALQSLPTGSGRSNVGIFYKELTEISDLNSVENFSNDWNGFFQVSSTSSAYSSMDLQADNRIGFIYEETLTGFGKRNNPVSTCFPYGEGQHNFDGFDNLYVAYELEYITKGEYSVNKNIDRRAFLQAYFTAIAADTSEEIKSAVADALDSLSKEPTVEEIDSIYALLAGAAPADKWDGKTLTFTNVQQNGKEYVLYIDDNNKLNISNTPAKEIGEAAEFFCTKEESGKYSFFNEKKQLYMIWRAGNNYGYNNNSGTLKEYIPTYCDWNIKKGSNIDNTYYLVSKRDGGENDGSIIIMATGTFDAWSNSEGYSDRYSNLFRIEVTESDTGIDNIAESTNDNTIYDLSGRRVTNPAHGIYIVNGKKVLVK
ncbi:MAG: DUF4091 domain-containing protein [Bacteroidaceae bacterium]|nr:DUF4091 domain-containing protein [Bacteroidaceae bacterium]